MNVLKEFIIDQMITYKKKHEDLFYNEDSILDMAGEDMDDLKLYEGIVEGLAIALEKLKEIEKSK